MMVRQVHLFQRLVIPCQIIFDKLKNIKYTFAVVNTSGHVYAMNKGDCTLLEESFVSYITVGASKNN